MTTPTPVTSARGQRKRAADFTGRQTEQLNELRKAELAEASDRMTMVTQQEKARASSVIDFETGEPIPEVEVREVEVNSPTRTIRVNQDITDMTWGREVYDEGNIEEGRPPRMGPLKMYTFLEGQAYRKVPVALAEHLYNHGYLSYLGA